MASAEAEVAKLSATLLQTAAQAEALCEALDKEEQTGIAKLFSGMQESFKNSHFHLLIAPVAVGTLQHALVWLFDEGTARVVAACLKHSGGLLEIKIGQQEFVFHPNGHGREHEHIRGTSAMAVLGQLATVQPGSEAGKRDIATLILPQSISELQDVIIYLARDSAVLREDSKTMLRLLSRCNCAAFIASSSAAPADEDAVFLAEILPSFEVTLPLMTSEEAGTPMTPWWRTITGATTSLILPEINIPTKASPVVPAEGATAESIPPPPPPLPDLLKSPTNSCRQALHVIAHSHKLLSAMDAVGPRNETELKQLSARQAPLAQRAREIDERAKSKDTKGDLDAIKSLLEDELQKIQMDIEDEAARSLMRRGKFITNTRELVEEIGEEDFEDVVGTKTIRRTVTEEFFDRVLGVISRDLREQLKHDCEKVGGVIAGMNAELDEILTRIRGSAAHLELPVPDEKLIWYHLKGEICITARCEVERPKRGIITVLTAGRKMMMPFFMTLGLIGFQSVKKSMSQDHWQMALLLIGACTYAYFEANSEQQEKFEKELEKIKDTLTNEISKIINDVQKEKVSRFNMYFNMLRKQTLKRVDEQVKMFSEARGTVMEREKQNLGNKLKTLDTRIKELQDFGKQMDKLQVAARDIEANARKALVEAAKTPAAAPARASATTTSVGAAKAAVGSASSARAAATAATASSGSSPTDNGNAATDDALSAVARLATMTRAERPPREARPERPAREPKEKKEEQPKVSAADRFAALRASFKK